MNPLEEVKRMKKQGLSEEQIIAALQEKKVPYREISQALEQSKIKAAVENDDYSDSENPQNTKAREIPSESQGMQQSIMSQSPDQEDYSPQYSQEQQQYPQYSESQGYSQAQQYAEQTQQYPQQAQQYEQYEQYQPQAGISTDTISEISEQIVSEKMTEIRKQLEKAIDFKSSSESKLNYLDERIKRIEKIIDTLQASVLKRIGDYVSDVQDIKNEITQTQKTFAKISSNLSEEKLKKPKKSEN